MIDILEDDEPITNGKSLPNEAHVAFSIEGNSPALIEVSDFIFFFLIEA